MVITHLLTEIVFHNFQPQKSLKLLEPHPEKQDLRLLGQSYTSKKKTFEQQNQRNTYKIPKGSLMDLESNAEQNFLGSKIAHTRTHMGSIRLQNRWWWNRLQIWSFQCLQLSLPINGVSWFP